jgi:Flp pilus assembly protein TadD
MSLVAELLSKVKSSEGCKKDIPPNLVEIVAKGKKKGGALRYFLLLGSVSCFLLVSGYYAMNYMQGQIRGESTAAENPPPASVVGDITRPAADPPEGGKGKPARMASANEKAKPSPGKVASPEPPRTVKSFTAEPADKEARSDALREEAFSDEVDSYIYSGRQHEEEKNYSLAVGEYLSALRLRPGDPFLLNAVAYCYLRLQMPERALQYALKAVAGSPQYAAAAVNAGICYAQTGNVPEAEKYLKGAMELDRFNRVALFNLGVLYEKEGRFEESFEMYKGLVSTGDYDSSIHMARILERTGKTDEARSIYREIINSGMASETAKTGARRRLGTLTQQATESK